MNKSCRFQELYSECKCARMRQAVQVSINCVAINWERQRTATCRIVRTGCLCTSQDTCTLTSGRRTNFPNGAKAFVIERKEMIVRLDWLRTGWLWNSSGCGHVLAVDLEPLCTSSDCGVPLWGFNLNWSGVLWFKLVESFIS